MQGKIIKGIGGFYYVHVPESGVYECRARGIFRKKNIKPLIGDNVMIDIIDQEHMIGNVEVILPRVNSLDRPTVANVDQILIVFAVKEPEPNLNLLDKFIISIERAGIEAVICFNKTDCGDKKDIDTLTASYEKAGYKVYPTSAILEDGIGSLENILMNKTTAFAGPSGVGKSTLLNLIQTVVTLETGKLSSKIKRGKHTTRHVELICFNAHSYVVDTPGFSNINIEDILADDLKNHYREFGKYKDYCRFNTCAHINEPGCGVKEALANGEIAKVRYDNYKMIYEDLKQIRRY
jgi:ribosome biogenesis GTPase